MGGLHRGLPSLLFSLLVPTPPKLLLFCPLLTVNHILSTPTLFLFFCSRLSFICLPFNGLAESPQNLSIDESQHQNNDKSHTNSSLFGVDSSLFFPFLFFSHTQKGILDHAVCRSLPLPGTQPSDSPPFFTFRSRARITAENHVTDPRTPAKGYLQTEEIKELAPNQL